MSTKTLQSTCFLGKKIKENWTLVGLRICKEYALISSKSYSTFHHLTGISEYCGCHTFPESNFYLFLDTKLSLFFYFKYESFPLTILPTAFSTGDIYGAKKARETEKWGEGGIE